MAYVMITSIFSSPSTLWITTSTLASWSCRVLSYVKFILKTGNQMFGLAGRSQWLSRLADLSRQPFGLGIFITNIDLTFGLVFSVHSMQTSWGVLGNQPFLTPAKLKPRYLFKKSFIVQNSRIFISNKYSFF